ncbi:serine/threonine protein kinase [Saprolegnia diclina VS20]|uniref:Serine/threonine protein kinase n=1 Tax=Saprolegnia diclina (strain VS20) TaxID=1156394 RepID=T0QJQ9_SAPDV|nr:serine/threonine protein kinase [Saprolegnia diclina VS20]EQC34946.1 serine/threonine protein kinase [Saprolegnia diclina VS20]|eukprot:XP_008611818.1 serine/threonine protein kinase [Saprolegnia diclina VS20]
MGSSVVLGGNRSNRRTIVFFVCTWVLYTVLFLAALLSFVAFGLVTIARGGAGDGGYEARFVGLATAFVRNYWRVEIGVLSLYETERTLSMQTRPAELTSTHVLHTLLYIFGWKTTFVGPLSAIPVAIWILGMHTVVDAPMDTYASGGLTVEVLVKWSLFLLAGLVIGQILCLVIVSISIGLYNSIFPSPAPSVRDECRPLARDIAINVYHSTSTQVRDTFARHPSSPTKPAPPLLPVQNSQPARTSLTVEKPLVIPQPSEPAPASPSAPDDVLAPTAHAHNEELPTESLARHSTSPDALAPIPIQIHGTAVAIAIASEAEDTAATDDRDDLDAELAALDKRIEDYKRFEAAAKDNKKLRRSLEKERRSVEDERQKLLEKKRQSSSFVIAGAHMSPAGPMRGPMAIHVAPRTYQMESAPDDHEYGDNTIGYSTFSAGSLTYSYMPGSLHTQSPDVYRNLFESSLVRSPPQYDQFDGPSPTQYERMYGHLSPPSAAAFSSSDFEPKTRGFRLYRSVNTPFAPALAPDDVLDHVHLTAYAPACVSPQSSFTLAVWAFLINQRDDMHEAATADGSARQLSRDVMFDLRRGALIHVTLELPEGFSLVDEAPTKALPWQGAATHVAYDIQCNVPQATRDQVLLKATVVVGTKVMILRAYVYIASISAASMEATELNTQLEMLPETFEEIPFTALDMKELVGRGNFGDAYRARYHGRDVVVKTIRASEFGDNSDQIVQEFRHEAAVLAMFGHHPSIVPFVGASTDLSQPLSLVTEYLPFGSLESHAPALSTNQKTQILCDAAAGFLNIHEGGFLHRDIAARNCLVDDGLRGKICDFGMCRRVNSYGGTRLSEGVGPLKYMAPESLTPPHAFSFRSDSYSFGVLMWETFTETKPFGDMPAYMAASHVVGGGRLALDEAVPLQYHHLIEACFHEDPTKRPSMATILQALLPAS